jgi:hypothetical protein
MPFKIIFKSPLLICFRKVLVSTKNLIYKKARISHSFLIPSFMFRIKCWDRAHFIVFHTRIFVRTVIIGFWTDVHCSFDLAFPVILELKEYIYFFSIFQWRNNVILYSTLITTFFPPLYNWDPIVNSYFSSHNILIKIFLCNIFCCRYFFCCIYVITSGFRLFYKLYLKIFVYYLYHHRLSSYSRFPETTLGWQKSNKISYRFRDIS